MILNYESISLDYCRLASAMISLLLLAACFGPPRSPTESEDVARFYALCNDPERVFIRRTVQAPGFAEGTGHVSRQIKCSDPRLTTANLLENEYQYYECMRLPWSERNVKEFKTFRFSIESAGSEACNHPWSDEMTAPGKRRRATLPEGKCLGVREYAKPKSRYLLLSDVGRVTPDGTHEFGVKDSWTSKAGVVLFGRANVIEMSTNEVLAEKTTYFYLPYGSRHTGTWTSEAGWGRQECPQEERARRSRPKKSWAWELQDVVIPKRAAK